jgi:carbonic anhydrase
MTKAGNSLVGMSLWLHAAPLLLAVGCTLDVQPQPQVPERAGSGAPGTSSPGQNNLDWTYDGEVGPKYWASLNKDWSACNGKGQSPVDLPLAALSDLEKNGHTGGVQGAKAAAVSTWTPRLAPLPLRAASDGRLVRLLGSDDQGLVIDGVLAPLQAVELHAPAEHTLGGASADLELVLWFKDEARGDVALSLLFRQGAESQELSSLISGLPPDETYVARPLSGSLDLSRLVPGDGKYLSYEGSQSYPPCTEGVTRLLLAHVSEIAAPQLAQLRAALPGTSQRPVQTVGSREIHLITFTPPSTTSSDSLQPTPPSITVKD